MNGQSSRHGQGREFVKTLVVLTDDLRARLDKEATRQTASRSLLIRLACEAYLAERGVRA